MGNYLSGIEGFESPEGKTAFRKFKKSKDFLRVYVEHDSEMKKILSDKGTNNEKHGVKTKVLKDISKKADSVRILAKNISFHVAVVLTTVSGVLQIFTKTVKAKSGSAMTNTNDEIITIANIKRVHAVYLYVPSHLEDMYTNFPQDMYTLIEKNKNAIELQSILQKEKDKQSVKAQHKKKAKTENATVSPSPKPMKDAPPTKSTEGFNPLKRRVLWSVDGTMKMMDL